MDGLYLIGERTSAAKVMGAYGSAQVAHEADEALAVDLCKDSEECIRGCPSKALQRPFRIDKKLCDGHHAAAGRKLQLEDGEQICGVCIRLCPVGKVD